MAMPAAVRAAGGGEARQVVGAAAAAQAVHHAVVVHRAVGAETEVLHSVASAALGGSVGAQHLEQRNCLVLALGLTPALEARHRVARLHHAAGNTAQ